MRTPERTSSPHGSRVAHVLAVALVACLAAHAPVSLGRDSEPTPAEVYTRLQETIESAMADGPTPGLALALVGPEGPVWARGFGYADLDTGRPVTPDTPFMLASVSKTFIAAAMMIEVEAGRLSLDAPVADYLAYPLDNPRIDGDVIRVRHLAAHTSGIRDDHRTYEGSYAPGDPTIEMDDWIRSYLERGGERYRKRRNFRRRLPGEMYEYSNVAAALGAVVTERTSGLPYRRLLKQRILDPLSMSRTSFDLGDFPTDTLAVPYDLKKGTFRARPHYGLPTYADGQLRSSANDLARYVAMMINRGTFGGRRILTEASVDRIETPLHPDRDDGGNTEQALYWHKRFEGAVVGHNGGDWGVSTFVFYHRRWRTGAVILMNSLSDRTSEMMITCLQAMTTAMSALRTPDPGS